MNDFKEKIKNLKLIDKVVEFDNCAVYYTNLSLNSHDLINFSIQKRCDNYYITDNRSVMQYLFSERGFDPDNLNEDQQDLINLIKSDYKIYIRRDFEIIKRIDINNLEIEIFEFLIALIKISNLGYRCIKY
ncbi:MAG: DUF1828 domain-containing protein [Promethearchaeota archaeon]